MLTDAQGLTVTTDSPDAIASLNQFAEQLLGYGNNAAVSLVGVAADPTGCADQCSCSSALPLRRNDRIQ